MNCKRCDNSTFAVNDAGFCPGCQAYEERFREAMDLAPQERYGLMTDYRG